MLVNCFPTQRKEVGIIDCVSGTWRMWRTPPARCWWTLRAWSGVRSCGNSSSFPLASTFPRSRWPWPSLQGLSINLASIDGFLGYKSSLHLVAKKSQTWYRNSKRELRAHEYVSKSWRIDGQKNILGQNQNNLAELLDSKIYLVKIKIILLKWWTVKCARSKSK